MAAEEMREGLEAEITRILSTHFGVMDVFLVLIEVMVSTVHTYLKAYEIRHVKQVQFTVYQLPLTKATTNNLNIHQQIDPQLVT